MQQDLLFATAATRYTLCAASPGVKLMTTGRRRRSRLILVTRSTPHSEMTPCLRDSSIRGWCWKRPLFTKKRMKSLYSLVVLTSTGSSSLLVKSVDRFMLVWSCGQSLIQITTMRVVATKSNQFWFFVSLSQVFCHWFRPSEFHRKFCD